MPAARPAWPLRLVGRLVDVVLALGGVLLAAAVVRALARHDENRPTRDRDAEDATG